MGTWTEYCKDLPERGYIIGPRVPRGLAAAVEGLTKEVLRKKPEDIYLFAARHFEDLLKLREEAGGRCGVYAGTRRKSRGTLNGRFEMKDTTRLRQKFDTNTGTGWSMRETGRFFKKHRQEALALGEESNRFRTERSDERNFIEGKENGRRKSRLPTSDQDSEKNSQRHRRRRSVDRVYASNEKTTENATENGERETSKEIERKSSRSADFAHRLSRDLRRELKRSKTLEDAFNVRKLPNNTDKLQEPSFLPAVRSLSVSASSSAPPPVPVQASSSSSSKFNSRPGSRAASESNGSDFTLPPIPCEPAKFTKRRTSLTLPALNSEPNLESSRVDLEDETLTNLSRQDSPGLVPGSENFTNGDSEHLKGTFDKGSFSERGEEEEAFEEDSLNVTPDIPEAPRRPDSLEPEEHPEELVERLKEVGEPCCLTELKSKLIEIETVERSIEKTLSTRFEPGVSKEGEEVGESRIQDGGEGRTSNDNDDDNDNDSEAIELSKTGIDKEEISKDGNGSEEREKEEENLNNGNGSEEREKEEENLNNGNSSEEREKEEENSNNGNGSEENSKDGNEEREKVEENLNNGNGERENEEESSKKEDIEEDSDGKTKDTLLSYILTEGSPCEIPESVVTVIIPDKPTTIDEFDDYLEEEEEDKEQSKEYRSGLEAFAFGESVGPGYSGTDVDFLRGVKTATDLSIVRKDLEEIREEEEEEKERETENLKEDKIKDKTEVGGSGEEQRKDSPVMESILEKEEEEEEKEMEKEMEEKDEKEKEKEDTEEKEEKEEKEEEEKEEEEKEVKMAEKELMEDSCEGSFETRTETKGTLEECSVLDSSTTSETKEETSVPGCSSSGSEVPPRKAIIVPELNLDSLRDRTISSSFKRSDLENFDASEELSLSGSLASIGNEMAAREQRELIEAEENTKEREIEGSRKEDSLEREIARDLIENDPSIEAEIARNLIDNDPSIEDQIAIDLIENDPTIENEIAKDLIENDPTVEDEIASNLIENDPSVEEEIARELIENAEEDRSKNPWISGEKSLEENEKMKDQPENGRKSIESIEEKCIAAGTFDNDEEEDVKAELQIELEDSREGERRGLEEEEPLLEEKTEEGDTPIEKAEKEEKKEEEEKENKREVSSESPQKTSVSIYQHGLRHTGEFHDSVPLPLLELSNIEKLKILQVAERGSNDDAESSNDRREEKKRFIQYQASFGGYQSVPSIILLQLPNPDLPHHLLPEFDYSDRNYEADSLPSIEDVKEPLAVPGTPKSLVIEEIQEDPSILSNNTASSSSSDHEQQSTESKTTSSLDPTNISGSNEPDNPIAIESRVDSEPANDGLTATNPERGSEECSNVETMGDESKPRDKEGIEREEGA